MSEEKFEQHFQVHQIANLSVSNIRGHIEIHAGDDQVIHITAIKHGETGDGENTKIELTQSEDGSVQAVTRFPEGGWDKWLSMRPCKVDYIIKAPKNCTLNVKGVSCDQLVDGLNGEISLVSVSGDLRLEDLAGTLKIKSVSGDVQLNSFDGTLTAETVSGDTKGKHLSGTIKVATTSGQVNLDESNLPSVEAKTVSGDIRIFTSLSEGPYNFQSVSGDVRLVVPADTKCSAEISSISGRLSTSLPQSSTYRNRGRQNIDIQGGGVKVTLKSVSGALSLAA